ncbi:MAG: DUF2281 domain-containing protein [Gemmatimonadales bacterium]|nr:DUF2281 domain-containing protein [Gemmatimonadales bacterium]
MNEFLRKRIDRKLETLPDERVYQVLDYIEFLESKYAARTPTEPSPFQKLAETVEDTLRAGQVSVSAIKGTMDVMSGAGRVMSGLAAAGKSVVDQVAGGGDKTVSKEEPKKEIEAPPQSGQSA